MPNAKTNKIEIVLFISLSFQKLLIFSGRTLCALLATRGCPTKQKTSSLIVISVSSTKNTNDESIVMGLQLIASKKGFLLDCPRMIILPKQPNFLELQNAKIPRKFTSFRS